MTGKAGHDGNGWKRLEMTGMAGHGWNFLQKAGNDWNGWTWQKKARYGPKGLKIQLGYPKGVAFEYVSQIDLNGMIMV